MPDYLVITSDKEKKAEIGRKLVDDVNRIRELYTPLMMEKMYEAIDHYRPGLSMEDKDRLLYMSIYDYWVYGATIDEDFYLHLFEKNDSEIREYMVRNIRGIYVGHMNSEAGEDKVEQLEDKYRFVTRELPVKEEQLKNIEERVQELSLEEEEILRAKEEIAKDREMFEDLLDCYNEKEVSSAKAECQKRFEKIKKDMKPDEIDAYLSEDVDALQSYYNQRSPFTHSNIAGVKLKGRKDIFEQDATKDTRSDNFFYLLFELITALIEYIAKKSKLTLAEVRQNYLESRNSEREDSIRDR